MLAATARQHHQPHCQRRPSGRLYLAAGNQVRQPLRPFRPARTFPWGVMTCTLWFGVLRSFFPSMIFAAALKRCFGIMVLVVMAFMVATSSSQADACSCYYYTPLISWRVKKICAVVVHGCIFQMQNSDTALLRSRYRPAGGHGCSAICRQEWRQFS